MRQLYIIIFLLVSVSFVSAKEKHNLTVFNTNSKHIYDICHSANGVVVVCTDNNSLKAFSVHSKELLASFDGGHREKVLSLDMSPDSTMLVSGGADSAVVIWDFITHEIIEKIHFAKAKINSVKFSPNNKSILFGCSDSKAYLYDIKKQKIIYEFNDLKKDINSVAFSKNGEKAAIAGADKVINIYNTSTFETISQLKGHRKWIREIHFYDNDKKIISCGDDRIIEWNLVNHKQNKRKNYKGWIVSVDIVNEKTENGNLHAYGTINGQIYADNHFVKYKSNIHTPITKVVLIPDKNSQITLAVATLGSGLIYLEASNMKYIEQ